MSDMYLVLRNRVNMVKDWAELGTDTMREARQVRGLSYEAVARLIPVSSKTYERWEKRGAVPRHDLQNVAAVLGLEVERPVPVTVLVPDPILDNGQALADLRRRQAELADTLDAVLHILERLTSALGVEAPESERLG
jgi:transcriptional regulator with XRE-family HTH domain